MRNTERGTFRRAGVWNVKGSTNLGAIQGFPQLRLIKQDLGIKTISQLEGKTESFLVSHGVELPGLKAFLANKGCAISFTRPEK